MKSGYDEVERYNVIGEQKKEDIVVKLKSRILTTTYFGGAATGPRSLLMYQLLSDETQVEKVNNEFRTMEPIPRRFYIV